MGLLTADEAGSHLWYVLLHLLQFFLIKRDIAKITSIIDLLCAILQFSGLLILPQKVSRKFSSAERLLPQANLRLNLGFLFQNCPCCHICIKGSDRFILLLSSETQNQHLNYISESPGLPALRFLPSPTNLLPFSEDKFVTASVNLLTLPFLCFLLQLMLFTRLMSVLNILLCSNKLYRGMELEFETVAETSEEHLPSSSLYFDIFSCFF